jgi:DNA-binding phage protein
MAGADALAVVCSRLHCGVQAVAKTAHLSATGLYRTLSPTGDPVLSSLSAILKAMGLHLAVQAIPTPPAHA